MFSQPEIPYFFNENPKSPWFLLFYHSVMFSLQTCLCVFLFSNDYFMICFIYNLYSMISHVVLGIERSIRWYPKKSEIHSSCSCLCGILYNKHSVFLHIHSTEVVGSLSLSDSFFDSGNQDVNSNICNSSPIWSSSMAVVLDHLLVNSHFPYSCHFKNFGWCHPKSSCDLVYQAKNRKKTACRLIPKDIYHFRNDAHDQRIISM